MSMDTVASGNNNRVYQGTCGWSDDTLVSCGKFYPPKVTSSVDKLHFYSRHGLFQCVEVNSSSYAIPSIKHVQSWLDATPREFVFHFKALGLFCGSKMDSSHIPASIREAHVLSGMLDPDTLDTGIYDEIWTAFNTVLERVASAGKLGSIVFQFPLSFAKSEKNKQLVMQSAIKLFPNCTMVVEFRNREWITDAQLQDTVSWMSGLRSNISLCAADELIYETVHLEGSPSREIYPIPIVPLSNVLYVRIHRRYGNMRLLDTNEISEWVSRIRSAFTKFSGPCYVLWGTDYEDQPIINAKSLYNALPEQHRCVWKKKNTIMDAFARAKKRKLEDDC